MKKELVAAGFVLFSLFVLFSFMLPLNASAANFSQIFVFGDSFSDTGNTFNATGGLVNPKNARPPEPPYFQGRFSNGKLWVEYFAEELRLKPTLFTALQGATTPPTQGINFAFAGSSTGLGNAVLPDAPLPGVLAQAHLFTQPFLANNQKADPNALYVIWGGANDYFFGEVTNVSQQVRDLSNAVGLLAQAGAKNIMVFNLPDLGKIPAKVNAPDSSKLTTLTINYNTALTAALAPFKSMPGVNIIPFDTYSIFNEALTNPSKFGFTNVKDSCANVSTFVPCTNQNEFLFYDRFHPTTATYRIVADAALAAVGAKRMSEK
ncbi:SGNH/GDSL hydrolase family protein [Scytonema sp. PCC 10023]|uniref:SGNH/GDSL hydrolase family protein n=1 Tax=Scytonema sp. PCC 10023 TaxID=1680591 RepID=UPI0039C5B3CB